MASDTRAIVGAVVSALQGIDGTGSYVHDLSGTDRVQIGRPTPESQRLPGCWVAIASLDSEHGPELGGYLRRLVVEVEARAPATADTTSERTLIAADLLDDVAAALEADRSLGGRVNDLLLTGIALAGDEAGIPGVALAMARVEIEWWATSGAGV